MSLCRPTNKRCIYQDEEMEIHCVRVCATYSQKKNTFYSGFIETGKNNFLQKKIGLVRDPIVRVVGECKSEHYGSFLQKLCNEYGRGCRNMIEFYGSDILPSKRFFPTFFQTRSGFYERFTNLYFHIREYQYFLKVVTGIVKFNPLTNVSQRTYL